MGAIATDLAWHAGLATAATTMLTLVVTATLLASSRLTNRQAQALVMIAPLLALWFSLRTSPWLLLPDLAAVAGIFALATSLADRGSVLDLSIPGVGLRVIRSLWHGTAAPLFAADALRDAAPLVRAAPLLRRRWREVVRGGLLAVPVVAILATLLASADAVFASMFRLDLDGPRLIGHASAALLGFLLVAGLLHAASVLPTPPLGSPPRRLGPVEVGIVLGSISVLFGTFAAAQVVALSEGGRRVIETAGMTYAQYARSGFFQLVAVAAVALAVVLGVRAVADFRRPGTRRAFVALGEICIGLTLVVVVVAVARMNLYERTYGLTMLRLYVKTFSLWIGAVFLLAALWIAGVGRARHWLPSVALAVGLAGLVALNAVNPEAIVVRRNVAHAERTGRFDPTYVAGLSTDAVPALIALLPRIDPIARATVQARLCRSSPARDQRWSSWNRSSRAAEAALATLCGRSRTPGTQG
jgi:hypothetical protein